MEQKKSIFTNRLVIALLAILCCALWGSATPFIKIGYALMLPEKTVSSTILFAGIRFTGAGIITVLIYSLARGRLLYPKRASLGAVAAVSCFQTILQYFFFYVGLANTSGVKGTVLSGSGAFFSLIIASLVFKQEKLTVKKIAACVLGFAGILIININGLDFTMNFTGDCFVLFSVIAYSVSSVLMKKYSSFEDPVVISGYQFILGGLVMIAAGLALGGRIEIPAPRAAAVLIYLSFLSAVAYSVWGVLLKHNHVSRVSVYTFCTPIFGVLLTKLMLTENSNVSPVSLAVTLLLVCTGILMLNFSPAEKNK